jgi:hypothetical protein
MITGGEGVYPRCTVGLGRSAHWFPVDDPNTLDDRAICTHKLCGRAMFIITQLKEM